MRQSLALARLCLWCLLIALAAPRAGAAPPRPDLRLLIDDSTRMQAADPGRARAAALELALHLLPDGARAGIWRFGDGVHVLVPHGEVDEQWRSQALAQLDNLAGEEKRADIPGALEAALFDLDQPDPDYRASIVVLSAGGVDVAHSPMLDIAAARDLLQGPAEQSRARGIPVHTLALGAAADRELLRSLARITSGLALATDDPQELPGLFLNSLELAANMPGIPVIDRGFRVDAGVDDLSVLVLDSGAPVALDLIAPDGSRYPDDDARRVVGAGYAMARVRAPRAGQWRIVTSQTASPQVFVRARDQLVLDPPPVAVPGGASPTLGLSIRRRGVMAAALPATAFRIYIDVDGPGGYSRRINVAAQSPVPSGGAFRADLPALEAPGLYRLTARLDAGSLQREVSTLLRVEPREQRDRLVTRADLLPGGALGLPLFSLGVASLAALIVVLFALRRRRRRKLAIWQKRARHIPASGDSGPFRAPGTGGDPPRPRLDQRGSSG